MRRYPIDSPEAMARLVAVALLADGGLARSELELLEHDKVIARLGMNEDDFDRVIHEFCDDLMQYSRRDDCGELEIGAEAIDAMLDEVVDPRLRLRLLRTIIDIVYADLRLSAGEAVLASQAMVRWGIDLHEIATAARRRMRRWPPQVRRAQAIA